MTAPASAGSATVGGDASPLAALRAYEEKFETASLGDSETEKAPTERKAKAEDGAPSNLSSLIAATARKHGVPVSLANAVVRVESNYNPGARGGAGEVGLMQIKPATARGMGYSGSIKALYDPATNLEWGMRYLAEARRRASGDTCGTILRYNAGHYARRMNPVSKRYCHRVLALIGEVV